MFEFLYLHNFAKSVTILLYPPGAGRKLNVHKTFRRRSARLVNVLCTFMLCSVTRGHCYSTRYSSLHPAYPISWKAISKLKFHALGMFACLSL